MKGLASTTTFLLTISYLSAITHSRPPTSKDDVAKFQLFYVGTADGKSFFADNSTLLTWPEARQFCSNSGMNLASITSAAQRNMLHNVRNTFEGIFWTGGRDARTHSQFVWDVDGSSLVETSLGPINWFNGLRTCVIYWSTASWSVVESKDCTQPFGALCELIV